MQEKDELCRFIVDNYLFGQKMEFSDDDSLMEKGIIDSTGILELVSFLEDRYAVRVEDEELVPENLDSVNNVLRFLQSKRQASAPAAAAQPVELPVNPTLSLGVA